MGAAGLKGAKIVSKATREKEEDEFYFEPTQRIAWVIGCSTYDKFVKEETDKQVFGNLKQVPEDIWRMK